MKKILFLPFLQIPSGHHQVVTTLTDQITKRNLPIEWEKVDILSYTYSFIEPLVSTIYLKWIEFFPNVYHWLYKKSVYEYLEVEKDFKLYELLFLRSMKRLLKEQNPSHIVCSHALPSYLVCKLKKQGLCEAKLINIYTDYFIHHIWGTTEVDAHFISLPSMKDYLLSKGVKQHTIYSTGIPVHEEFFQASTEHKQNNKLQVLITGGSLGVGQIDHLLEGLQPKGDIQYHVLCGNNHKLYARLLQNKHPRITPYNYISCKKKLNSLYDSIDAVFTKPGGITVSECLVKQKPIFIYNHLPGQEKINVDALQYNGLISVIPSNLKISDFEDQMIRKLTSMEYIKQINIKLENYNNSLLKESPIDLILQDTASS